MDAGSREPPAGALELFLEGDAPGWLKLDLDPGTGVDQVLCEALTAAVLPAHQACAMVARVAAVSRRAHAENLLLRRRLRVLEQGELVARSPVMHLALERAELVAGLDTPVLLRGETGTGKSALARWIHERSNRAGGAFVTFSCGALPDPLLESELFGHEPGAFTGAQRRHTGRLERAAGGSLFLDEIGELTPAAQVKLLRVLQEGEFEPLGAERTVRVKARILAATHRPLEAMVEEGALREDLYYRLNVFPLIVPPLRERLEDLPELVEALLKRVGTRAGLPRVGLTRRGLARLASHSWPGNVRELEHLLERAMILARGEVIDLPALESAWAPGAAPAPRAADTGRGPAPVVPLVDTVRRAIQDALRATHGRIYGPGGAAALLGLKPTTLQTKMRRLGISREPFVASKRPGQPGR